jgi:glyoxylase-like metal-dependent hydrolase (beta-lactamase superfamily II)
VKVSDGLAFPFQESPEFGLVSEVAPGILWARLPLPYRLDHINVYFIEDDGGWAIVDCGIADADSRAAWVRLLEGPLAGARFTQLIVTHHHPDHIGLAGWICEKLEIPLLTSLGSYLGCTNICLSPGAMEAQSYREFYRDHGMQQDVASVVLTLGHAYLRLVTQLPATFRRIVSGDTLRLGGRDFIVLSGDGHAPEQVMLYSKMDDIFLAADQVMTKVTPNIGVWVVDPTGDPLGLYLRSLRMLEQSISEGSLVLPGHHLPFVGLHERCRQLIAHHVDRCEAIALSCASSPQSVAEVLPVLFPRKLDVHQLGFAFNEVHAHINYMLQRGELEQIQVSGISKVRPPA